MLEELVQIRRYIDEVIETYKDLHPDEELPEIGTTIGHGSMTIEEYNEYSQTHTAHRDDKEYIKETALKRIREGYYENKFSKSKREKTTGPSKGQSSLCVYGDT